MATFYYCEAEFISSIMLLVLFLNSLNNRRHIETSRIFRHILLMVIAVMLTDMICIALEKASFPHVRQIIYLMNMLYFCLSGAIAFSWLRYTCMRIYRGKDPVDILHSAAVLPLMALLLFVILSPLTHWLFYIDGNNHYERGRFFSIQTFIVYGYMTAAMIISLRKNFQETIRSQKQDCIYMSLFVVPPFLGGLIQLLFYGINLTWPATAISLLIVYVNLKNKETSIDALTSLNNRGRLDIVLQDNIENAANEKSKGLSLLLMDIDNFKHINDTFGHVNGDEALIQTANILKKTFDQTDAFISRYGGDEFAVLLKSKDEEKIKEAIRNIETELEKEQLNNSYPYHISLSIGYAIFGEYNIKNMKELIAAADQSMYEQKKLHKVDLRR